MADALPFPLLAPSLAGGAALYLTGEDTLRVTAFNAAAGVTLTLRGRFLPERQSAQEGPASVGVFELVLVPTTNRVASVATQPLGAGWLLDWSVVASAGTPNVGQCYVVVSLVRGFGGALLDFSTIGQGYVTAKQRLSGPSGLQQMFTDGGGALRSIAGATPAAGAEISEAVPTGARWELLALTFVLTTAVAVANRVVRIVLDDGTTVYCRLSSNTNQAASITAFYTAAQGVPFLAFSTDSTDAIPLPSNLKMGAGHRWRTLTAQIQAADQFSVVQYLVREWMEGA